MFESIQSVMSHPKHNGGPLPVASFTMPLPSRALLSLTSPGIAPLFGLLDDPDYFLYSSRGGGFVPQ